MHALLLLLALQCLHHPHDLDQEWPNLAQLHWRQVGYLQICPSHNAITLQTEADLGLSQFPQVLQQRSQLTRTRQIVRSYVQKDF